MYYLISLDDSAVELIVGSEVGSLVLLLCVCTGVSICVILAAVTSEKSLSGARNVMLMLP